MEVHRHRGIVRTMPKPKTKPAQNPTQPQSLTLISPLDPQKDKTFLDLEGQLNDLGLSTQPRGCLVTIRNNTSADREATIVSAGVQFYYYTRMPEANGPQVATKGNYMAGPVHVEVSSGEGVPFRFSDPRYAVFGVSVGLRVMFGNAFGYPPAHYVNYFWTLPLPPLKYILPEPLYRRVGELHLDFRMRRDAEIKHPPPKMPPLILGSGEFPPVPIRPPATNWFEIAERPR
jgi:hypothetical protein